MDFKHTGTAKINRRSQLSSMIMWCYGEIIAATVREFTVVRVLINCKIIRSLTWFFRNTLAKFRTFSVPLSNFRTIQVLKNPNSNFRTLQDPWNPDLFTLWDMQQSAQFCRTPSFVCFPNGNNARFDETARTVANQRIGGQSHAHSSPIRLTNHPSIHCPLSDLLRCPELNSFTGAMSHAAHSTQTIQQQQCNLPLLCPIAPEQYCCTFIAHDHNHSK